MSTSIAPASANSAWMWRSNISIRTAWCTAPSCTRWPTPGQICATIEIKINYFKPITQGRLTCVTEMVNRGKTVANLESRVYVDELLVAQANGNYAIFTPSKGLS